MGALTTTEGRKVIVATSGSSTEPLRLVELAAPSLGPRDVRVRVHAIGVNPVDWKMREGGPLRFAYRFVGPSGPLVIGVDFAGEVIEAGPDADLSVGDRVVGGTDFSRKQRGSYATEVVVRDDQCAKLPDEVSFEDAACLPIPGATALRAFEVSRLSEISPPEEARVLVLGASGGVGIVTLQLLRAMGAKGVGVCSTRNVALVEEQGGIAVDYTKGDALEAARANGPYDLILHAMSSETYPLAGCRSLLSKRGVVAIIVVRPADVWSMIFFPRQIKNILGRPARKNLEPLVAALAKGDIAPIIEERFPLEDAEKAHVRSKAGKVVGKLVLVPS